MACKQKCLDINLIQIEVWHLLLQTYMACDLFFMDHAHIINVYQYLYFLFTNCLHAWVTHIKMIIKHLHINEFSIKKIMFWLIIIKIFVPRHSFVPSPSNPSLHLQTKWAGKLQHSALSTHNEASSGSWHSSMSTHVVPSPV